MKIASVARVDASSLGVCKKIEDQAATWRRHGHEVRLFLPSSDIPPGTAGHGLWPRYNLCNPRLSLIRDLRRFKPDLVYWREEGVSLFTASMLADFRRRTVMEINGSTRIEGAIAVDSFSQWRAYKLNTVTQPWIVRSIAGIVTVSHELAVLPEFAGCKRGLVAPNSIDLHRLPIRKTGCKDGPVRIAFLGSADQIWHGVDKLPGLCRRLGGDVVFHVIGSTEKNVYPDGQPHEPGIILHGYLPYGKFKDILSQCHLGLGSLAFHRINMYEASPLKVREYIAAGLPVILPYNDTAFFEETPPWVLRLSNSETTFDDPDNVALIKEFCLRHKTTVVSHAESARFVDSMALEKKKLDFFEEIVRSTQ